MQVYVGGNNGGVGVLQAHLSDSSAADYTDNWTSSGNADRTYTLDYSAASAGQTITVTWTLAPSNPGGGGITISGAALNRPPTVATAASAAPGTVTGTTTALSALGADDGGESNLTYTWATTGTPPAAVTFSANGNNAAKNATATFTKAGSYSFQVTITDAGGLTATSSVGVTVNQTLSNITVSPASASLNENATQQFAATAYDQFGQVLGTQPAFTWSSTGVGGVNSTGLYTAPALVRQAAPR